VVVVATLTSGVGADLTMPNGALAPGKVLPKFSVPMNGLTRPVRSTRAACGAAPPADPAPATVSPTAVVRASAMAMSRRRADVPLVLVEIIVEIIIVLTCTGSTELDSAVTFRVSSTRSPAVGQPHSEARRVGIRCTTECSIVKSVPGGRLTGSLRSIGLQHDNAETT